MRIAIALLLMCGCNQIFGLEAGSGDDDDPDGAPLPDAAPDGRPGDLDSDGVLDGDDNCPSHFNPIQADEDGEAEINGGDACDLCPHHGGIPGMRHLDSDGDGLGDDCDPDDAIWHCLRWFDGFSDGSATQILARYRRSGGVWNVDISGMVQGDPLAASAELTIDGVMFDSPRVETSGRMVQLPTTGPTGNTPYRNTAGVLLASVGDASTCFGSVTRDVSNGVPTAASVMLSSRNASEIIASSFLMGGGMIPMNAGERFAVTLDALTAPTTPGVAAALYDRGAADSTGGFLTCAPGGGGLRTSFASIRFEYLLVLERGTDGVPCPARLPMPSPPP